METQRPPRRHLLLKPPKMEGLVKENQMHAADRLVRRAGYQSSCSVFIVHINLNLTQTQYQNRKNAVEAWKSASGSNQAGTRALDSSEGNTPGMV